MIQVKRFCIKIILWNSKPFADAVTLCLKQWRLFKYNPFRDCSGHQHTDTLCKISMAPAGTNAPMQLWCIHLTELYGPSMLEKAKYSQTYEIWHHIPEDIILHNHHHGNLKSHNVSSVWTCSRTASQFLLLPSILCFTQEGLLTP
jgi:hypothetical protein